MTSHLQPEVQNNGSLGDMHLLTEFDQDNNPLRYVRLEATADGRSVVMVDIDLRKPGILRESQHEITPDELVALIRAHGAELPGENFLQDEAAEAGTGVAAGAV